jgi:hypothetical protein
MPAETPEGQPGKPATALVGRLAFAHLLAYPLAFVAALAAIAPVIVLRGDALLAAPTEPEGAFERWLVSSVQVAPAEASSVALVLVPSGVVGLVVFVLAHVAALPWALARAEGLARARRIWLWTSLAPVGAIVLAGAAAWLRIALAR